MLNLHRTILPTFVLSLAVTAAVVFPSETLACSPPAPALTSSIPADGAYYPGNGILLFNGFSISLEQVTVTVDGVAASFVDASMDLPGYLAPIAVRVSPKPLPDQVVKITGSFCSNCTATTITYTARADDGAPPDGIISAKYHVHDYPDFQSGGGDCQISSDLALWLHANTVPANEEEAPAALFVEAFADEALTKSITSNSTVISSSEFVWGARLTTGAFQGTAPTNVCFRLTTADLAGNTNTEPFVLCQACYSRTEPQTPMPGFPPGEPMWADADAIKGGPCDWSVGVGGEPRDDSGCSFGASENQSTSWVFVVLGLTTLAAARQRARRSVR